MADDFRSVSPSGDRAVNLIELGRIRFGPIRYKPVFIGFVPEVRITSCLDTVWWSPKGRYFALCVFREGSRSRFEDLILIVLDAEAGSVIVREPLDKRTLLTVAFSSDEMIISLGMRNPMNGSVYYVRRDLPSAR